MLPGIVAVLYLLGEAPAHAFASLRQDGGFVRWKEADAHDVEIVDYH